MVLLLTSASELQVVVGPKALMHPDVEEALPGTTYNALTRRAGTPLSCHSLRHVHVHNNAGKCLLLLW